MAQIGNFFVSAGEGMITLFFILIGAFVVWKIHSVYPRAFRWFAWLLLAVGVIFAGFSFNIGLFLAILGAIFMVICDNKK